MEFDMYTADVTGDAANCMYPHYRKISTAAELANAVSQDYVFARFKGNYRSTNNFESSTVIAMDCDNNFSEDPNEWMTIQKAEREFASVTFGIIPSRNHQKAKNGKEPRDKFHIIFEIDECTNAEQYKAIKEKIYAACPFFDPNALDSARFFFGSQVDEKDIILHEGFETIEEFLGIDRDNLDGTTRNPGASYASYSKIIRSGERNNTLSRFAARVLKRYGETDKTKQLFLNRAEDCEEPLDETELNNIWSSAVNFYNKKIGSDPNYKPPSDYNSEFGNFSLKPDDYTDMGQAAVFAAEYGDVIKYTDGTDYIRFNNQYWCESRMACIGALEEFLDLQLADAEETLSVAKEALLATGIPEETVAKGIKTIEKECDTADQFEAAKQYAKALQYFNFVIKRRDYKYIQSAANAAKPMLEISINDLDANGFLINTPNLTIDLTKDISEGHAPDPADLITKQTRFSPGDDGKDLWLEALDLFFCGDAELIEYVQRIIGMAAIGEVFMESMLICWGEGRNGKSTAINTIANVLGSYAGTISAETLTVGCRHNARPEIAELKGKRLVIAAELEDGMRLNTAVVKKLCSTDEISAEKKYKDPFKYKPSHTLVLYTNHLPRVGVNDPGTWRRLIVIPFNAKIEGDSDIKNYTEYLTKNAGPYVMKWIIEGAQKAIADQFHFKQPAVVSEAIDKYRKDNDWLGLFFDECCELDDSYHQKSGEFYQTYREFCMATGEFIRGTSDFYAALEAAGYEKKKSSSGIMIRGVRLKKDDFLE